MYYYKKSIASVSMGTNEYVYAVDQTSKNSLEMVT